MTRWTKTALILSLILAVVVAPRVAFGQGGGEAPPAPMSEAAFIELAGAEKPGEGGTPEPGRPHEAAKSIEEPKKSDEEEPGSEGEGEGSGEGGEGSDDDEEAGKGEDGEGADDAGEGETPGSGDDDEEDAGEGGDEDEKPVSGKQKKLDAEFQAALEAEGASVSLEDIPEEARPKVAKKLKDLEAGFTRAMQGLRGDQKAASSFRAEERFRKEKPADFIVSMLLENPDLAEQVNDRVGELEGNKTAVEGHKALVEKARREASAAEDGEAAKAQERESRIDHYIKVGRAAARAAGVPFDMGVEEGIAARIALSEDGTITEAEIRKIAASKAAVYQRQLRQDRRDRSGKYVDQKVADRKKAGLKVKPGKGSAPAPAARALAKNDQEFIEEFAGRS